MRVLLVCLFSAVSAEASFGALGFSKIHDSLGALQLTGSGRNSGLAQGHKMLIERFLQQAAASGELKPSDRDILESKVLPLISDLKAYMQREKIEDDDVLEGLFLEFNNCEYPLKSTEEMRHSNAQAAWNTLVTCRIAEAVRYGTDVTDCGAMDTFLVGVEGGMTQHCNYPEKTNGKWVQSDISQFETKLTAGKAHIETAHGTFTSHNTKCTAAARALHEKHVECESADTTLYSEWCEWASIRTLMCNHQSDCHTNAENAYAAEYARLLPRATSRIMDARAMYLVDCLVQELIHNNITVDNDLDDWTATCEASVDTTAASEIRGELDYFDIYYGIQRQEEPAEQACDRDEPKPVPGDANWVSVRYDQRCPTNSTYCTTVMKASSANCP